MRKIATILITLVTSIAVMATEGALSGKFTINANGEQVVFSQGNLLFQPSTQTWQFTECQYTKNVHGSDYSSTSTNWLDLFAWGTSGYNNYSPNLTSSWSDYYLQGEQDIANTNYDWGVYNSISNGGAKAGIWFTLSYNEWNYILNKRNNWDSLRGHATIYTNENKYYIGGYVLLPDDFVIPTDLTFNPCAEDHIENDPNYHNTYTFDEWSLMEQNGAVFLPHCGTRYEETVGGVTSTGEYWTSTHEGATKAKAIYFTKTEMYSSRVEDRSMGLSVRMVQKVSTASIEATECGVYKQSKFIRDGQLLIEMNGKLYNATGVEIK